MLNRLIDFLKKHNERATIVGLGLGLVVFVVAGIYLQKKNSQEKEIPPPKEPTKIELEIKPNETTGQSNSTTKKTSSYYLRPSPAELLEQLSSMENLQENVAQSKLQHLRVLWPVYYFSIESIEGRESLLLDISEDGFGVEVRGHVKSGNYPNLIGLKAGDKIWVAGEIESVDPSGTGTVYLNIELLDYTDAGPLAATVELPATTDG
jgi:hypothetical protein